MTKAKSWKARNAVAVDAAPARAGAPFLVVGVLAVVGYRRELARSAR